MIRSMNYSLILVLVLVLAVAVQPNSISTERWESILRMPTEVEEEDVNSTRWALLVAGSNGYANYRHQADVCHAYQILKNGGLKEDNIIVFMYDDIATNVLNPRPGVIINHPDAKINVYQGVPKDYTGENVTAQNLYAVILGDKKGVKGGSGKVMDTNPNDRIFIYYSDHGGPGVLGMPNLPFVYANDFIQTLKTKHASNTYKEMVVYVEACESGSIFQGLMPKDLQIYVATASNSEESSWGTYCPGMDPAPPPEYITCLADLFSVAWMEDSETHNLKKETILQQYTSVKDRTSNYNTYTAGSHVMEYGNKSLKAEKVYLYQGFDPKSVNFPPNNHLHMRVDDKLGVVNQRDADLLFLWEKYKRASSEEKQQVLKEIEEMRNHRSHLDTSIQLIGSLIFGPQNGASVLYRVRGKGLPLVDDWDCLKSQVRVFEEKCGSLTQYGMKHMRAFANICNDGVSVEAMEEYCGLACDGYPIPSRGGYTYSA